MVIRVPSMGAGIDLASSPAAQRFAAHLRARVMKPRLVSDSVARTAEVRGRQLQKIVGWQFRRELAGFTMR
jgi:hypothetical protein